MLVQFLNRQSIEKFKYMIMLCMINQNGCSTGFIFIIRLRFEKIHEKETLNIVPATNLDIQETKKTKKDILTYENKTELDVTRIE